MDIIISLFSVISIESWLTIGAIIMGPILALQAQKVLEKQKSRQDTQEWVFRTLMATRASTVSIDHVNALNMIDMAFREKYKKEKPVVRSWRELLDQFGKFPRIENYNNNPQDSHYLIALANANERAQEKLVQLLSEMSTCLDYDFETVHIRNGCYAPTGHAEIQKDQDLLRKLAIGALAGNHPLQMRVTEMPEQPPHESAKEFLEASSQVQKKTLETLEKIADKLEK